MSRDSGALFPATKTHTYRQKMQRSFAAEFLAPFDEIEERLEGDYSEEQQAIVAEYFGVGDLVIRNQLVSNGRIEREELDSDAEMFVKREVPLTG